VTTMSAHADLNELVAWASATSHPPQRTFVNHGELDASLALRDALRDRLGWQVEVPHFGDVVGLATASEQTTKLAPV